MATRSKKIVSLLQSLIPEIDEALQDIENDKGWLVLNDKFTDFLISSKFPWWNYYEDEPTLRRLSALIFYDVDQLVSQGNTEAFRSSVLDDCSELLDFPWELHMPTPEEAKEICEELELSSPEEQQQLGKEVFIRITGMLSSLFNYLSLMVHGRTLCQLVAAAKTGDDDAFCRAVQIDRTVLRLPFFQDRLLKAQFSNDEAFLIKLGSRIKNPLIRSKIRYRTLWLTFAILDDESMLNLPHEEILDICEQVGVYGKKYGVEDVGHLRKRLLEYRRAQKL